MSSTSLPLSFLHNLFSHPPQSLLFTDTAPICFYFHPQMHSISPESSSTQRSNKSFSITCLCQPSCVTELVYTWSLSLKTFPCHVPVQMLYPSLTSFLAAHPIYPPPRVKQSSLQFPSKSYSSHLKLALQFWTPIHQGKSCRNSPYI